MTVLHAAHAGQPINRSSRLYNPAAFTLYQFYCYWDVSVCGMLWGAVGVHMVCVLLMLELHSALFQYIAIPYSITSVGKHEIHISYDIASLLLVISLVVMMLCPLFFIERWCQDCISIIVVPTGISITQHNWIMVFTTKLQYNDTYCLWKAGQDDYLVPKKHEAFTHELAHCPLFQLLPANIYIVIKL